MTGLEVARISRAEFDDVRVQKWLASTAPELFREYLQPSSEARRKLLADRYYKLFAKAGAEVRVCRRGEDYLAILGLERQDWDSRHFGVECARLSPYGISGGLSRAEQSEIHEAMLRLGIEWARSNNIKVLQRRLLSSRSSEITILEDLGFHLVDNVVTLAAPIKHVLSLIQKQESGLSFRPPAKHQLGALVAMTRGVFPHSRFVNDRVLRADLGDELYLKWLATVFGDVVGGGAGASAEQGIIVATMKEQIVGYVAYQVERALAPVLGECIGAIELIVVDAAHQGMRIGQNLFAQAARALHDLGANMIESSTWINQRLAMASNQKAGLRVCENLFTYHCYP